MENQETEVSKRREKRPRRSSILKRALVDINNGGEDREKRRVSFQPSIMVKEFQKNNSGELEVATKSKGAESSGSEENYDNVYMVPANQSYYQVSTPVGDKRRRLSSAPAVSRLSIIPPLEKSFASSDDTPDFELFEDSSEATAPKEAITLQEPTTVVGSKKEDGNFWASIKASDFVESTKQENESFNLSCMDHASVADNALVINCPSFDGSNINSPSVDHDEMMDKPAEEGNTTVFGDSSMELTLEGEQLGESIVVVEQPFVAQAASQLEPFSSVLISSQHAQQDLPPGNDVQDLGSKAAHPTPDRPRLPEASEDDHSVKAMSLTNVDDSHIDLHKEDTPQGSMIDVNSSQASHQPVVISQLQSFEPCHTVYGDADMSLTSVDGSHIDIRIKLTNQPNEEVLKSSTETAEAVLPHHDTREKQPSNIEVAVVQTQPLPPVVLDTDGQNQPCSSEPDVATTSHPVTSSAMPQVKPPPTGFKRPRILASSVVSKRMAFGKTRTIPKPNTPKLAAGQVQHLQLPGSGMPLLRSPSITASLLKKKSKTPAKIVTAQLPPTPQSVSALPPPASAPRQPPCSPLVQSMSITRVIEQRPNNVIEHHHDSPATESPGSSISLVPCTTTYTVAPQTEENDKSYMEIMMPNTEDDDWLTNPNNDNPSILESSANITPAVHTTTAPVVHSPPPPSSRPAPVVNSPPPPSSRPAPVVHSPPPSSRPAPVVHSPPPPSSRPAPVVHSPPPPSSRPAPVVHSPLPSSRPAPVVHSPPPPSSRPAPVVHSPPPPSSRPAPVVHSPPPPSSRPGPVVHSPPPSSRPAPVVHSPPPPSSRPGPVVHSPLPSSRPAPVVHSPPPPSSRPGPVVHSPPPSSRPGPVVHSPLPSSRPAPVVHSPPPPSSRPGPVVHSPLPSSRPAPVVHSPPLIPNPASSAVFSTTTTASSVASNTQLTFTNTARAQLNPDVITTPHLVVLDQLDTTISPLPAPALSVTMDQSRLEPVPTGGMDRTIRVISPTTLGKFAAFANADKTINLAAEYEQQLLQEPPTPHLTQEHSAIASDTPKQGLSMVDSHVQQSITDPVTLHIQSMVDPVTPRQEQSIVEDQVTPCVQSAVTPQVQPVVDTVTSVHPTTPQPNVQQNEDMEDETQPDERNKSMVPPEEERPSAAVEEEHREVQVSAVQLMNEQCEDTHVMEQTEVKKEHLRQQQTVKHPRLPDESHAEMLATSLPLLSSGEDQQIIINILDDLLMRFKSLHKATLTRVLSNYCNRHEGLRERLEHYYEIIHCCIGMIRCLIDYSRLTDMAETPCSITLQPSLLPNSDQDIRGELVLQARWLLALCKTLEPLYRTCHKAMSMLFKRSGWVIHSWKRDEVNVHFGKNGEKLQLKFVLDMNKSEGKYGKVQCQKVTEIIIEGRAKGCSVPKGLKCSSVLDIPVALQMVSLAV